MTTATAPSKLDKISFIVLQATLFLSPIFFIPSITVPFQTGKSAVILFGIAISLVLWLIARLRDGVFSMPKTFLFGAAGIFGLAYAVAALVSGNSVSSLGGQGFEIGSLAFLLPSLVLFALVPLVTKTKEQVFYSYATLLFSLMLVGLFQVARFIGGPSFLSFGLLTSATANLIGKWNDVGIFFGFGALVSLITLEKAALGRLFRALVYISLILSLAILLIVGFSPVWITLAVLSLVLFIYELSFGRRAHGSSGSHVPYHTLAVLVISVVFAFFGTSISGPISTALGTSQVEVRPSWSATLDVSTASVKDHPLFGAGPNRFASEWLAHKPANINSTLFWNVDFNYGIGFVPSLLVTTGIVGFLAALYFIGLFLWNALKALFRQGTSPLSRYLVLSSLFGSVYLWIFAVVYVPSNALWILTLALSGLFIAALREDGAIAVSEVSVAEKPALSFVSVLLAVILLIATISFGYFVTVKLIANADYNKGVSIVNSTGDLDKGEAYIAKAIALSPSDAHYQSVSEIYLVRLNQLIADANAGKVAQADAQAKFQSLVGNAITAAQAAVAFDSTNYQNYLTLGRAYESVVPSNIQGAFEKAKAAYEAALALNPQSPEINLVLARLEVANKDTKAAEDYIAKALQQKNDYADAIYLLAQIQIANNDIANAIKSVSAVATLSPSDPGIFFQLGLLYYSSKDYQDAVLSLERAVALNPQYANAKYFLGLSYYLTGAKDKSLAQFQDLAKSNPDSQEVKDAIANLQAGKSPVPQPSQTVKQPTLPVKQ